MNKLLQLKDGTCRTALVTGAAGGIGSATGQGIVEPWRKSHGHRCQ
jgi:NAD(P)-dependent dehydrogenase (short-subunit alcohol dehydrogenase family)